MFNIPPREQARPASSQGGGSASAGAAPATLPDRPCTTAGHHRNTRISWKGSGMRRSLSRGTRSPQRPSTRGERPTRLRQAARWCSLGTAPIEPTPHCAVASLGSQAAGRGHHDPGLHQAVDHLHSRRRVGRDVQAQVSAASCRCAQCCDMKPALPLTCRCSAIRLRFRRRDGPDSPVTEDRAANIASIVEVLCRSAAAPPFFQPAAVSGL